MRESINLQKVAIEKPMGVDSDDGQPSAPFRLLIGLPPEGMRSIDLAGKPGIFCKNVGQRPTVRGLCGKCGPAAEPMPKGPLRPLPEESA
jgi:hypothetical protein